LNRFYKKNILIKEYWCINKFYWLKLTFCFYLKKKILVSVSFFFKRFTMSNAPNPLDTVIVPVHLKKVNFYKDEKKLHCGYVKIEREDHTLGNIIHHKISQNRKVIFSGYKKTHPLENFILLKIMTDGTLSPLRALENVLYEIYSELSLLEDITKAKLKN
jgi:DNA-directed RNA polymerase subunit L